MFTEGKKNEVMSGWNPSLDEINEYIKNVVNNHDPRTPKMVHLQNQASASLDGKIFFFEARTANKGFQPWIPKTIRLRK